MYSQGHSDRLPSREDILRDNRRYRSPISGTNVAQGASHQAAYRSYSKERSSSSDSRTNISRLGSSHQRLETEVKSPVLLREGQRGKALNDSRVPSGEIRRANQRDGVHITPERSMSSSNQRPLRSRSTDETKEDSRSLRMSAEIKSSGRDSGYSGGYREDSGKYRDEEKVVTKKKKRKKRVTCNLSGTRYDIVRQVSEHLGMVPTKDEDPNAYLIWNDSFVSSERIAELKPFQRINHFPGMGEICRKDCLARNMMKMCKVHAEEYGFVPKTWIFPSEYTSFVTYARDLKKKKKNRTFIVKPSNGAMGNGIMLIKNPEKLSQTDHTIVQEYVDKPFLVDGYKCDLRIYVLVTCCDPLRIFLYNDGLLRMGTEQYTHPSETNLDQLYMHLTNYSVNKHNDQYEKSGAVDTGSKRSLRFFNDYLRRHDYDVNYLWKNITDIIIKTLVVAHPHVLHAYRMCRPGQSTTSDSVCFEVLGFDIIIDRKLRPWLLEINRSPSFGTDEKIDYDIKSGVIGDALRLLNIKPSDKRKNMAAQKAAAQSRLLRPTKRGEEQTLLEKKRQNAEKKKFELKDMLARIRKDATREDFENRNCGRFKRIFPPDDAYKREKYTKLIADSFKTFLSGRASTLQQEIEMVYNNKYKEEDILDMLAQCEADEKEGKSARPRGPKPLQSMPTLDKSRRYDEETDEEDDEESDDSDDDEKENMTGVKSAKSKASASGSRVYARSIRTTKFGKGQVDDDPMKSQEDELTQSTLHALTEMRIKFPGKSDNEAEIILDKLHENWKFHKPRIASYWLVKLDSIKRRKVIDIVRSNVKAVLQRVWVVNDVEILRLFRLFNRVFNRLLSSQGQGLWNCFQSTGNSWESIFSKSTENILPVEMLCCRRIVQLCRDCLLIVYQFASEAKSASGMLPPTEVEQPQRRAMASKTFENSSFQPLSQKISRLYSSRSRSLNNLNYGVP